jgi:VanZ family protein
MMKQNTVAGTLEASEADGYFVDDTPQHAIQELFSSIMTATFILINKAIHRLSNWFAWAWLLIVSYASLTPLPDLPLDGNDDKLLHVAAYAGLSFLAFLRHRSTRMGAMLICAMIVYSGLIEVIQPYVNRHGEVADLVANSLGVAAGCLLAWAYSKALSTLNEMS